MGWAINGLERQRATTPATEQTTLDTRIAALREEIGKRKAAGACPAIVPNSDIVQRITALGGVPLRKDREVDVRYVHSADNRPVVGKCLATDGKRLYLGRSRGLFAFHLARETWEPLRAEPGPVTCLQCSGGVLWAGTEARAMALRSGSQA
jgi:hypothetical protein